MLSCKESTQLISESLDRPLHWRERLALKFHLMICVGCRRFGRQQRLIRCALGMMRDTPEKLPLEVEAPSTQTEINK